jgi:uncharacterized protein
MSEDAGIPVADVKAASGRMLQKQLYAITTTPVAGIGPVLQYLEEHLEFQLSLERDGILFAAGPLWSDDEATWHGEGLVVIRAASREEAVALAQRDPMHARGARRFSVRPWMVNEGTINLRLDCSTQTFTIA